MNDDSRLDCEDMTIAHLEQLVLEKDKYIEELEKKVADLAIECGFEDKKKEIFTLQQENSRLKEKVNRILSHVNDNLAEVNDTWSIEEEDDPTKAVGLDLNNTKPGDLVQFNTYHAGHDWQKDDIKKTLYLGNVYTVKELVIHGWHSEVYLEGFPDHPFNTVFFRNYRQ